MANLFVSNLNDSGSGSLRSAMAFAQANSGTDFDILFSSTLAGGEIRLLSPLELLIGNVTLRGDLDGDGNPDITISGDSNNDGKSNLGDTRLFTIAADATVTLDTLRLSNAFEQAADTNPGQDAASIAVNAGNLFIIECLIEDGFAIGGNGASDDTFTPVDGGDAAGILNTGSLEIRDSIFERVGAAGGFGRDGILGFDISGDGGNGGDGAIVLSRGPGTAQVQNVVFRDANVFGGGGGDGFDSPENFDGGNGGAAGSAAAMIFNDGFGLFFTKSIGLFVAKGAVGEGGTSAGGNFGANGAEGSQDDNVLRLGTPSGFGGVLTNDPGTAGDDTLFVGTATASPGNADIVLGFFGDDTILGLDGSVDLLSGGGGNDFLFGRGDNDVLIGGDGNDTLKGDAGFDTLSGNSGDDTYIVDVFDTINEDAGQGTDRVLTTASFSLAANVEVEVLATTNAAGIASIDLTGNALGQEIIGNAGVNTLNDGGKGGADTLRGLGGNDTYRVNNAGTTIVEAGGQGEDRAISAVDYTLAAGAAVERLTTNSGGGTTPLKLTGNALFQTIVGNAGDNLLSEGAIGAADILSGLGGNDSYRIFNSGAVIEEKAGGGTADRAIVSIDYKIAAGVQVERLVTNSSAGTAALSLTGNELKQEIIGNAGANILHDGGAGAADTMEGLGGSDTYRVFNAGDVIVETTSAAGGTADKVLAAVSYALGSGVGIEILQTDSSSGTGAIKLSGNEGAQTITGNAGGSVFDGKGGADTITTLGGKDFVDFSTKLGAGNIDTITDFSVSNDTFRLDDAIFTAFAGISGTIQSGQLRINTTGKAQDSNDFIIYDSDDGKLFYDADANGGGVAQQFAIIGKGLALTNVDFNVI